MLKDMLDYDRIKVITISYIERLKKDTRVVMDVLDINSNLHDDFIEIIKTTVGRDSRFDKSTDQYLQKKMYTDFVSVSVMQDIADHYVDMISKPIDAMMYLEQLLRDIDVYLGNAIISFNDKIVIKGDYRVIGMRTEYEVKHHHLESDDSAAGPLGNDVDIIVIKNEKTGKYYEILIYTYQTDCYSGYCSADYGVCNLRPVNVPIITSKILNETYIDLPSHVKQKEIDKLRFMEPICLLGDDGEIKIENLFAVSRDGNDYYYPCGSAIVMRDKFEIPNKRQFTKKPVWVFSGSSGSGKSYLSNLLCNNITDKTKFETDSVNELPEFIYADIIVMGNKTDFTMDDIISRIPLEHEMIEVKFKM